MQTGAGEISRTICDVATAYVQNPYQFHGDTGIKNYLYYRMLVHAGSGLNWQSGQSGVTTLLLQVEHYTQCLYMKTGTMDKRGRFDLAIVPPEAIDEHGKVNHRMPPSVAIEVGRNKGLEAMGQLDAGPDSKNVKPGDACKLLRELRFGGLGQGYLLEFYDEPTSGIGSILFRQIVEFVEQHAIIGLCIAFVFATGAGKGAVLTHPATWLGDVGLPSAVPTVRSTTAASPNRLSYDGFLASCGPCNTLLQMALQRHFAGRGVQLLYGSRTMTIRRGNQLIVRVGNRNGAREALTCVTESLRGHLERNGVRLDADGTLTLPALADDALVAAIVSSVREVLASGN